jgi:hypothetical protein
MIASDVVTFFESAEWKLGDPSSFKRRGVDSVTIDRACT